LELLRIEQRLWQAIFRIAGHKVDVLAEMQSFAEWLKPQELDLIHSLSRDWFKPLSIVPGPSMSLLSADIEGSFPSTWARPDALGLLPPACSPPHNVTMSDNSNAVGSFEPNNPSHSVPINQDLPSPGPPPIDDEIHDDTINEDLPFLGSRPVDDGMDDDLDPTTPHHSAAIDNIHPKNLSPLSAMDENLPSPPLQDVTMNDNSNAADGFEPNNPSHSAPINQDQDLPSPGPPPVDDEIHDDTINEDLPSLGFRPVDDGMDDDLDPTTPPHSAAIDNLDPKNLFPLSAMDESLSPSADDETIDDFNPSRRSSRQKSTAQQSSFNNSITPSKRRKGPKKLKTQQAVDGSSAACPIDVDLFFV
jgi:hypothetical protein